MVAFAVKRLAFWPLVLITGAIVLIVFTATRTTATGSGATLEVDRTDDNVSATDCTAAPNDCSLRGAIIAANTLPWRTWWCSGTTPTPWDNWPR